MATIDEARSAVITRVLDGDGTSTGEQRRAAFEGHGPAAAGVLIEKIAKHAYKVSDEDIAAVRAAGLTEDQIFELAVCAALGQASRQLDNALAALAAATKE